MASIVRSVKSMNMMDQIKSVGAECQAQAQKKTTNTTTYTFSPSTPSSSSSSSSVTTSLFEETMNDDIVVLPNPVQQPPKTVLVSQIFPHIASSPPKQTTVIDDPDLAAPRTDHNCPSKKRATIVDLIKKLDEPASHELKMMQFVDHIHGLIKQIDVYIGDIAAEMNTHIDFANVYRMSLVFRIWEITFHLDYVKKVYKYREELNNPSNVEISESDRTKREFLLKKYTSEGYKKFLIRFMKTIFSEDSVVMMDIFEKYYPKRSFYDSIYYLNIEKIIAYIQEHQ